MNKYELTVVVDEKAGASKKKAVVEKVTKMIETLKGKVEKTTDWGQKEYGLCVFFSLELDGAGAKVLNDKLRLESEINRYLLIKN
ncbi:MAG: 30S ribosomal protein S6 [Patescibacteria group bacterium]